MNKGSLLRIPNHENEEEYSVLPSYSHCKETDSNQCFSPQLHRQVSAHEKRHVLFTSTLCCHPPRPRHAHRLSENMQEGCQDVHQKPHLAPRHSQARPGSSSGFIKTLYPSESPAGPVTLGPHTHTTMGHTWLVKALLLGSLN